MNRTLYIFNPEHDLALANFDRNFNPPQSAKKLASDLACLPVWIANEQDYILAPASNCLWLESMKTIFPDLAAIFTNNQSIAFTEIQPWGWDQHILQHLSSNDQIDKKLVADISIEQIRNLSHRKLSIQALNHIYSSTEIAPANRPISQELFSVEEVRLFASQHSQAIFKAPWSGSGKGLCWTRGGITESHLGWCKNIIQKQGSVIAEKIYDNIQDFAMLFKCHSQQTDFIGYSLFETEKGTYRSNELKSNDDIIKHLSQWIHPTRLEEIKTQLNDFITRKISPNYNGYLGIDMFVYQQNEIFELHPCVEINLRMTMGIVARFFYDKYVSPSHSGKFYIDHNPKASELLNDHIQRSEDQTLSLNNKLITSGYLSLTQVNPDTHYRVRVEIV